MITKETLKTLVEEWLAKGDYFLVDIQMDGGDDRIVIEIDHADGVWIEDCAELSRFLQEKLGDELGDYEMEVGSAGLGQPFKVAQQYVNHVGDDIEVIDAEGKKRPVMVDVDKNYTMDGVKYAKYVLAFK